MNNTKSLTYIRLVLITAAMCISGVVTASAQESVQSQDDISIMRSDSSEDILSVARLFGSAATSRQQNGDPLIAGSIENIPYVLRFLNCTNRRACEDINFRVGFQVKPTSDVINAWNASKRFTRAYLDGEGDAILEMDVVVNGGVSAQMLNTRFEYWRISLDQFTQHIGFR